MITCFARRLPSLFRCMQLSAMSSIRRANSGTFLCRLRFRKHRRLVQERWLHDGYRDANLFQSGRSGGRFLRTDITTQRRAHPSHRNRRSTAGQCRAFRVLQKSYHCRRFRVLPLFTRSGRSCRNIDCRHFGVPAACRRLHLPAPLALRILGEPVEGAVDRPVAPPQGPRGDGAGEAHVEE